MRGMKALIKKELFDIIANKKLLILLIIYFGWGVMCPIFAKFTPDVLEMYATEGMIISMQEPTAIDAWYQFFKDGPTICVIILLVSFSNVFSKEVETGTIINVLSKGIARDTFLISKYVMVILVWILGITMCVMSCEIYTKILFPDKLEINYLVTLLAPMIFGIFIISVMMTAQVISCSYMGTIGIVAGVWGSLLLANTFKPLQQFNPIGLAQNSVEYATTKDLPPGLFSQFAISVILSVVLVTIATVILRKKQI